MPDFKAIFVQRSAIGVQIVLPEQPLSTRVLDISWTEWQSIVHYASQGPKEPA